MSSGITAQNMVNNYQTISRWLDKELKDSHSFETFVFYFMHRLVLINLAVEQTDVSDGLRGHQRPGVRLRPYEILKGKLLGQIDEDRAGQRRLQRPLGAAGQQRSMRSKKTSWITSFAST